MWSGAHSTTDSNWNWRIATHDDGGDNADRDSSGNGSSSNDYYYILCTLILCVRRFFLPQYTELKCV